jgi:hypothetical protein
VNQLSQKNQKNQRSFSQRLISKQASPIFTELQVSFLLLFLSFDLDGSSYAFATLTADEKDPQIQNLVDVNKGPNEGKCYLEQYQFIRVLKINSNAFTNIDEVKSLPYLLEL